jgi:hypothetical protein
LIRIRYLWSRSKRARTCCSCSSSDNEKMRISFK